MPPPGAPADGARAARRRADRCRARAGRVSLGTIIFALVLAGAGYLGVRVALIYWARFNIQEAAHTLALQIATGKGEDQEARQTFFKALKEWGVSLTDKDVSVTTREGIVTVSLAYYAPLELPKYTHWFYFEVTSASSR